MKRATTPEHAAAIARERARADVTLFARQALAHALRLPFAPFHRALFRWHAEMGRGPLAERVGRRYVLAAPRGGAKSTVVSYILLLHDVAYARERYVVLLSATQRQARQRLAALRAELTRDTPLARWFAPRFGRDAVRSTANSIEVGDLRIDAFGAGTEIRGISHGSWRPTKIVLDDAETSAAAESSRRRERLHDWFAEVVEHLGDRYTHLLAIGTVLHPRSLLSTLLERPDFAAMRCRAMESFPEPSPLWDEWRALLTDRSRADRREAARRFFLAHRDAMQAGARTLWPQQADCEELMAQLVAQGRRAFFQEKQNEPLGPEDALFDATVAWRARRTEDGWVVAPPPGAASAGRERTWRAADLRVFGYLDSALGKGAARGRGDFAALATVALAPDGTMILAAMWLRRAAPTEQVAALFDAHEAWPFDRVAVEGTGFQELLSIPIEDERRRRAEAGRRADLAVAIAKPRRAKALRIARLEPLLSAARLALADTLPEEFWTELSRWPKCDHDDALDAAAGAMELATEGVPGDTAADIDRVRRLPRGAAW